MHGQVLGEYRASARGRPSGAAHAVLVTAGAGRTRRFSWAEPACQPGAPRPRDRTGWISSARSARCGRLASSSA